MAHGLLRVYRSACGLVQRLKRRATNKKCREAYENHCVLVDRMAEARRASSDLAGSALCAHYGWMGVHAERLGQAPCTASSDGEFRGLGDPSVQRPCALCFRRGI